MKNSIVNFLAWMLEKEQRVMHIGTITVVFMAFLLPAEKFSAWFRCFLAFGLPLWMYLWEYHLQYVFCPTPGWHGSDENGPFVMYAVDKEDEHKYTRK